ncbi:MAG: divergent PAP2 family protein [Clostridia bacterium]|nr:divergent PAP2 family protein [Clostridia bacterium]
MNLENFNRIFAFILPVIINLILPVLLSMIASQLLKTLLKIILTGKFDISMLFDDGDFPSSHTAVVTSATISVWNQVFIYMNFILSVDLKNLVSIINITDSQIKFILSIPAVCIGFIMTVVAMIVIRDAMGVRYSVKHNAILQKEANKKIAEHINSDVLQNTLKEIGEKFKIKEGHLKHEVVGGLILAILVSLLYTSYNSDMFWIAVCTLTLYVACTLIIFVRYKFKQRF